MDITISDERFKETLKEVLVELLQENRGEFISIISESLEEFAMGEAIKEGLKSKTIQKEKIFKELEE